MAEDRQSQLDALIRKRDSVKADVQRISGRLDSAKKDLKKVEEECRERGVAPDQLDTAIQTLTTRYGEAVADLEEKIQQSEEAVAPYLEE